MVNGNNMNIYLKLAIFILVIIVVVMIIILLLRKNNDWTNDQINTLANQIKTKYSGFFKYYGIDPRNSPTGTTNNPVGSQILEFIGDCLTKNDVSHCLAERFADTYKYNDKYINPSFSIGGNSGTMYSIYILKFIITNTDCLKQYLGTKGNWNTEFLGAVNHDVSNIAYIIITSKPQTQIPTKKQIIDMVNCVVDNHIAAQYSPIHVLNIITHILVEINLEGIVTDVNNISQFAGNINNIIKSCTPQQQS